MYKQYIETKTKIRNHRHTHHKYLQSKPEDIYQIICIFNVTQAFLKAWVSL